MRICERVYHKYITKNFINIIIKYYTIEKFYGFIHSNYVTYFFFV